MSPLKVNGYKIEMTMDKEEFCMPISLKINNVPFYIFDLGLLKDLAPKNAPPCGCGNRAFVPDPRAAQTLKVLNLPAETINQIIEDLVTNLHVGYCKRCH